MGKRSNRHPVNEVDPHVMSIAHWVNPHGPGQVPEGMNLCHMSPVDNAYWMWMRLTNAKLGCVRLHSVLSHLISADDRTDFEDAFPSMVHQHEGDCPARVYIVPVSGVDWVLIAFEEEGLVASHQATRRPWRLWPLCRVADCPIALSDFVVEHCCRDGDDASSSCSSSDDESSSFIDDDPIYKPDSD